MMSFVAAFLALILAVPALAADEPDELVPGRITVVKTATTFTFIGKPAGTLDLPDPANDPTVEGGMLVVTDTGDAMNSATFPLPAGPAWKRIPSNTSKPLKGYRYRGAGTPDDPCRSVLVKEKIVKATCRGSGVTLTTPFSGDIAIILSVGMEKRYCATFGGTTVKNTPTITRRRNAPPPSACGSGGGSACACGATTPQLVTFTNGVGSGNCGSITGGTINDIACGGLYFGGGLDAVPLPIIVPDFAQPTKFRVDSCSGTTLNVGATTATDVGSDRSCTSAGCFFGPPLPVPNPLSTPTSTCLYNVAAQDAQGTLACDTGDAMLSVPLFTGVFLTGDLLPNRCQGGSNPGGRCTVATQAVDCPDGGTCQPDNAIQACPICNPVTNVCNGGMDNGMTCVPGSTQSVTGQFPTSHDCRVSTLVKLGDLDVRLDLTTGTDGDTAGPSGTQQRVFCGFCRDADATGAFQQPAVACESNAGCAQPFEACEQRSQGAFANGEATMLSATGDPGGSLADFGAHPSTLVSVFCIPPVFNGIIDGQADLPGPGAITLPGSIQLSATLSASGAFVDSAETSAP